MTRSRIFFAFIREASRAFFRSIRRFLSDVYNHAEAIVLLVLSSLGLNLLLQEIPFIVTLPMWVEAAMVIPVLSVIGIQLLTWNASRRAKRRIVRKQQKVQVKAS